MHRSVPRIGQKYPVSSLDEPSKTWPVACYSVRCRRGVAQIDSQQEGFMSNNSLRGIPIICSLVLVFAATDSRPCGHGSGSSSVVTLPTLGGSSQQANAVNAAGQITGFS